MAEFSTRDELPTIEEGDKLDDDQKEKLLRTLRKEEQAASNFQDADLLGVREDGLDYYDREERAFPNGGEGMSSVVTSEFADTVEATMPSMMRIFAGTERVVEFTPCAPGQEKFAQEATDYIPHELFVKNDGYRLIYWYIKDALMFRLSGVTVDIEDYEETKTQPVKGIPQDAIDMIKAQLPEGATIDLDLTADIPEFGGRAPEAGGGVGMVREVMTPEVPQGSAVPTFSGTITVTQKKKRVVVDNIAPEDILFTPTAREQDKASFLGFRKKTTESELVALGLPKEDVDLLKSDRPISPEETLRNPSGILGDNIRNQPGDSERPLWVVVAYIREDLNDDGISEMYRCVYAHSSGEKTGLIEVEEWDGPASISLASPILMSHVIVGRSLFDQTKDLQDIGTVLTRGLLNNQYMVTSPRPVVSDQVNLDSLIDWVPGSPIRLKPNAKPGDNHVAWLQVPSVMGETQAALEMFNAVRENRTGIVRHNQGLDADTLNKTTGGTASGMNMLMSAGQARQELIARTLAEPIKRIYRLIYRALKKSATGPSQYWSGNAFKSVDPTQWPDDLEMTVNVGAGTRDQSMQGLSLIASSQEKLITLQGGASGPYVLAENVANLVQRVQETLGYRTPGLFFQPPEAVKQLEAQKAPPPPSPEQQKIEVEKIRAQAEVHRSQTQSQVEASKAQSDHEVAMTKINADQTKAHTESQKAYAELIAKNRELDLREQELALKAQQLASENHHKEADRALKQHEMAMAGAMHKQDQFHQRQMARAKTPNGEGDGMVDSADANEATAPAFTEAVHAHFAEQKGGLEELKLHMAEQTAALKALATAHHESSQAATAAHAAGHEQVAGAINNLAHAHMAESEITGPSGKTYRARKVRK